MYLSRYKAENRLNIQVLEAESGVQLLNTIEDSCQYGIGEVGVLENGITVVARPGSETGGATLEIVISKRNVIKIRY